MTHHRRAPQVWLYPVHRSEPKPESRMQDTSYLGLPPTHARADAWPSDHGRDVRRDERSRQ